MTDFTFKWNLEDLKNVTQNGLKVFSCFACGGGSTMGYKMSGYTVLGCNEIDPEMIKIYKNNHNPKYAFLESISTFRLRDDLPEDLFDLDILDGSPPCSSFSMAGSREKEWGEKKKFREGQAEQVLDDSFFDFIKLGEKLKPKVIIAENVSGMLKGNAKGYTKEILKQFREIGYEVQLFLLNGVSMGLPQRRKRVFFVARRKDLKLPKLFLNFMDKPIPLKVALSGVTSKGKDRTNSKNLKYWELCKPGESFSKYHPKGSLFNCHKLSPDKPANTITAHIDGFFIGKL